MPRRRRNDLNRGRVQAQGLGVEESTHGRKSKSHPKEMGRAIWMVLKDN